MNPVSPSVQASQPVRSTVTGVVRLPAGASVQEVGQALDVPAFHLEHDTLSPADRGRKAGSQSRVTGCAAAAAASSAGTLPLKWTPAPGPWAACIPLITAVGAIELRCAVPAAL